MLSKNICKYCVKYHRKKAGHWSELTEFLWEEYGAIICYQNGFTSVEAESEPPEICPFALEHVMETQGAE